MKKLFLTLLTCLLFLSPNVVMSEELWDLMKRDGIYYKKFNDVPFSGEITGQIQGTLKNGKWEGSYVSYHPNGQLWFKGNYKNGKNEGVWIDYWENGQLMSKGNYKNGEKDGEWVGYWKNGKLMDKGNWRNGLLDGAYFTYSSNGTLNKNFSGTYKNGDRISD